VIIITAMLVTGGATLADWDTGDPCVYSQLPDTTGWDVYSEWQYGVADDWTAATSQNISDIHFWGSWKDDWPGSTGDIRIQIFSNNTSGSFPKPGTQLWDYVAPKVGEWKYTVRKFDNIGQQGWYDPRQTDEWDNPNHQDMYQYNIQLPSADIFQQIAGETYWLQVSSNYDGCLWGWKSSVENDNGAPAVFWDTYGHHGWYWQQLKEPQGWCDLHNKTPVPLGMAFVLTPEPATLLLLAAGAAAVLRKRKK
jgi:hypothetical protein